LLADGVIVSFIWRFYVHSLFGGFTFTVYLAENNSQFTTFQPPLALAGAMLVCNHTACGDWNVVTAYGSQSYFNQRNKLQT
jgi:hypothetical protein